MLKGRRARPADRLALLWRLVLLRGFRGEICGLADADVDIARAAVTVDVALVQVGGRLVWGWPKSKAGERVVALDSGSVASVKAHRTLRKRERLAAGEAWADSGRMFTDELGEALHPDYVSRRFRELAKAPGRPVIKFHAARHYVEGRVMWPAASSPLVAEPRVLVLAT